MSTETRLSANPESHSAACSCRGMSCRVSGRGRANLEEGRACDEGIGGPVVLGEEVAELVDEQPSSDENVVHRRRTVGIGDSLRFLFCFLSPRPRCVFVQHRNFDTRFSLDFCLRIPHRISHPRRRSQSLTFPAVFRFSPQLCFIFRISTVCLSKAFLSRPFKYLQTSNQSWLLPRLLVFLLPSPASSI